jgi:DNA repair protein RadC
MGVLYVFGLSLTSPNEFSSDSGMDSGNFSGGQFLDLIGGDVKLAAVKPVNVKVHSIDITPSMVQSVISEGQALFETNKSYASDEGVKAYGSPELAKQAIEDAAKAVEESRLGIGRKTASQVSEKGAQRRSEVAESLRKRGFVDYRGITVKSVEDAAEVIAAFRHPKIEQFQIVYLKDNVIVGHQVVSSGMTNAVKLDAKLILGRFQSTYGRLQADSYYLGHNHPSGDPKPSREDEIITKKIRDLYKEGFKGHIVTNGEKFAVLNGPKMTATFHDYKTPKENFKATGESYVKEVQVAKTLKSFLRDDKTTIMFIDSANRMLSIDNVENGSNLAQYIGDAMKNYGASAYIVASPSIDIINKIKDNKYQETMPGNFLDLIYVDTKNPDLRFETYGEDLSVKGIKTKSAYRVQESFPKKLSNESGQVILPGVDQIADMTKEVVNFLVPRAMVPRESLDTIMTELGKRNKLEFELENKLMSMEKMFEKMPRAEQVAFIDNIKLGRKQATPQLDALAKMMRDIEDVMHAEALKFNPSLSYLDNHYRVLWKVIPGQAAAQAKGGFKGVFRRPLQGSKGFMKQHTLADMSEGLAKGGVPYSYNPMIMWRNGLMDMQKFITANRMFRTLKKQGKVKFVRAGKKAPDGFVKLSDRMAQVYFKVPQGMINMGEYWIEENTGRILNNFLSRDLIRESSIGKGLMAFKNITTSIELSLSPFHAAYTSLTAVASSMGLGFQKMYNRGLIQTDPKAFLDGLSDVLLSVRAPYHLTRVGTNAIQMVRGQGFLASPDGQAFIKEFPDAERLLADLFTGGGQLAIHQDYKIRALDSFKSGLKNREPWAVVMSSLPAVNETIMKPLFEMYIPRLKIGSFLREYSNELVQRADQLASGKLTRPQLAREVWDSIENRFGEMNFDNLFWNRTFKSALQLVFRSVTWKIGAVKNMTQGLSGQPKEILRRMHRTYWFQTMPGLPFRPGTDDRLDRGSIKEE